VQGEEASISHLLFEFIIFNKKLPHKPLTIYHSPQTWNTFTTAGLLPKMKMKREDE
jgi:hypothetical protein